MNDEIKEIVKEIECYRNEELCLIFLSREESNALLDYINNLQQENERLKENNGNMQEEMARVWEENKRLKKELFKSVNNTNKSIELTEDYKYRCEKAIEYFKYQLENLDFYEDTKAKMLCAMGITLLQNGDDKN